MADEGGNSIPVRIDIAGLESDFAKLRQVFAELFTQLEQYQSKAIAPVAVSGMTELNASIKDTNVELQKLIQQLNNLNSAQIKSAAATDQSDVAVKKYRQTLQDIIELEAELEVLDTEAGKRKQELAAKYELEVKAIKDDVAAKSQLVQANNAATTSEKLKTAAITQETNETKKSTVTNKEEGNSIKTLALNYSQLKAAIRDKENAYVQARGQFGKDSPQAKAQFADLEVANAQLRQIDKELDSASKGSVANFGRALTGMFSNLRNLAYILPGIGIAGIFNLAFEAISKVVLELGIFNDKFEETLAVENKFADIAAKVNKLLQDQIDYFHQADQGNVQYYEHMLAITKASGVAFQAQIDDIHKLNKAKKEQAETDVETTKATYESVAGFNTQLKGLQETKDKLLAGANKANERLKALQNVPSAGTFERLLTGLPPGVIFEAYKTLQKAGKESAVKEVQDFFDKEIELNDKNYSNIKTHRDQMIKALTDVSDADAAIKAQTELEKKFFADQAREITLSNAEATEQAIETRDQIILGAARSTEQQQLKALDDLHKAKIHLLGVEKDELEKQYRAQYITEADYVKASNNLKQQKLKEDADYHVKDLAIKDKYAKIDIKTTADIVNENEEIEAKSNEIIFNDTKESLDKRLEALDRYLKVRFDQINNENEKEKALAGYDYFTPLQKFEFDNKQREKTFIQLQESIAKSANVFRTYVQQTTQDLKEYGEILKMGNLQLIEYSANLHSLAEAFLSGAVNFKKFEEAFTRLNFQKRIEEDQKIIDDSDRMIEHSKSLFNKYQGDINQQYIQLDLARKKTDEAAKDAAVKEAQEAIENLKKGQLTAVQDLEKAEADKLKAQNDIDLLRIKSQEDIDNQIKINKKKIGDELIDLAQQIADTIYQKEIEQTERMKELTDQQYDHELAAVEKSTLAQKDKTALEIQLNAEKTRSDEEADKKLRRLKHEQAIADKAAAMAHIVWDTSQAIMSALTQARALGLDATALAITYGIIGALQLAKVAASPVPPLAEGTEYWKGGPAQVGEAGTEIIKEPGRKPYRVDYGTVKYLPKGTQVIPTYSIPTISERSDNSGWEQTKYLASVFKKGNNKTQKIVNNIKIDLGWEVYKKKILYGINN